MTRLRSAYQKGGAARVSRGMAEFGLARAGHYRERGAVRIGSIFRKFMPNTRRFEFDGQPYRYFVHPYHVTWQNERAIEIPLLEPYVNATDPARTLEIGNVWGSYFERTHEVVDKYEQSPGVTNIDLVDFKPKQKYDLIFSISTFEHIGLDEKEREPAKVKAAIELARRWLSPQGEFVVTIPVGYNQYLDYLVENDQLGWAKRYAFKRVSRWMEWEACDYEEVRGADYGRPYRYANALVVLVFRASAGRGRTAATRPRPRSS